MKTMALQGNGNCWSYSPFPYSFSIFCELHYESEATCNAFDMKISFVCN